MTCSNWILTVLSIVIFVFTMWPDSIGMIAAKWVIGIAAIVILIVACTGVDCKYCENMPKVEKKVSSKKKK